MISLDASRVGIIKLGDVYSEMRVDVRAPSLKQPNAFKPTSFISPVMKRVVRQSILVHEARHSDCTGGITAAEIESFLKKGVILNSQCGQLHVMCPKGHDLEGFPACDGAAWGAYAIGGIFSATIAKTCSNCTEDEKQAAYADAVESYSRVLVIEDMINGKAGKPDMSSSGLHD